MRSSLAERLATDIHADVVPGVANFILFHLPPAAPSAAEVVRRCREHGLYVRDFPEMASLGPAALRIAVKDAATNERMLRILRSVMTDV